MRAVLAAAVAAIAFLAVATPALADTAAGSTTGSPSVDALSADATTSAATTDPGAAASTATGSPGASAAATATTSGPPVDASLPGSTTSSPDASSTASASPSSSAGTASSSTPTAPTRTPVAAPDSRRVVVYYQKHYENDPKRTGYISALPLLSEDTGVDVVNLAAIHMNKDPKDPTKAVLNVNDDLPSDPMYDRMWAELHQMQDAGIPVIAMIGGAVNDTWPNLESDFETQYAELKKFVQTYRLDGIDLDIELDEAQQKKGLTIDIETVVKVIDRLRADFGPDFLITSSPVMNEFGPGNPDDPNSDPSSDGVYGVDFNELYRQRGDDIAWFNMQAYCGHGLPTPEAYDAIIDYQQARGAKIPPEKLVIAALTNKDNCEQANGYVPLDELTSGLTELVAQYPTFGGVAGWEYFNSEPGLTARPWEWAARMRAALDADPTPTTTTPTPTPTPTTATPTSAPFVPIVVAPTWTVAPAPVAAPVAAYQGTTVTDQRTLAATGVDVGSLAALGTVTTLLGGAALLARRRISRTD